MSERLPTLMPFSRRPRRVATAEIERAWRDNKRRLLLELAKDQNDRFVRNNVRAYRHIIGWLEEEYDLC